MEVQKHFGISIIEEQTTPQRVDGRCWEATRLDGSYGWASVVFFKHDLEGL